MIDIIPLLIQAFGTLWYLFPILFIITICKTSWWKGVFGEFQINLLLKLFLSKKNYYLIKNVTLPTTDGTTTDGTTQIDHILVAKYGVFVIETKNMKGWIFGTENQKQWTQKIFKHSNKFQNPLHQNYKHTKTIESLLNISPTSIYSVIVFIGNSTFKTQMPANITYARECLEYIKSKKTEVFTQEEVTDIIEKIETGRLQQGIKTNLKHVAHVKTIIKSKEKEQKANCCPKCGAEMVLRKSKKGTNADNKFWGCSSFPKCRAIVQIT